MRGVRSLAVIYAYLYLLVYFLVVLFFIGMELSTTLWDVFKEDEPIWLYKGYAWMTVLILLCFIPISLVFRSPFPVLIALGVHGLGRKVGKKLSADIYRQNPQEIRNAPIEVKKQYISFVKEWNEEMGKSLIYSLFFQRVPDPERFILPDDYHEHTDAYQP